MSTCMLHSNISTAHPPLMPPPPLQPIKINIVCPDRNPFFCRVLVNFMLPMVVRCGATAAQDAEQHDPAACLGRDARTRPRPRRRLLRTSRKVSGKWTRHFLRLRVARLPGSSKQRNQPTGYHIHIILVPNNIFVVHFETFFVLFFFHSRVHPELRGVQILRCSSSTTAQCYRLRHHRRWQGRYPSSGRQVIEPHHPHLLGMRVCLRADVIRHIPFRLLLDPGQDQQSVKIWSRSNNNNGNMTD